MKLRTPWITDVRTLPILLFFGLLGACTADSPTEAEFPSAGTSTALSRTAPDADRVDDLAAADPTATSVSLSWTQVDGGDGKPAWYEIRYAPSPMEGWDAATVVREGACAEPLKGDDVGTPISCSVGSLEPGTAYEFQLVSFRRGGAFRTRTAVRSNPATATTASEEPAGEPADSTSTGEPTDSTSTGETTDTTSTEEATDSTSTEEPTDTTSTEEPADTTSTEGSTPSSGDGVWISPAEVSLLPTSGGAWENLKAEADGTCGSVVLSDQDQDNNVCVMAKALAFARTGQAAYRTDVVSAIGEIVAMGTYDGRALALGRELPAYVIAADLIGLSSFDSSLDGAFRAKLRELLTTPTHSGPDDLVECHEDRPNNWGTHCGAARAAVAAYLGDTAELERVARVFKGWLGDRASYAGFRYGDLSWQCDEARPVGINPAGCTRDGHPVGGVLPDDQRRGGGFTWPPPRENYVWEGLQGALVQAVILHRAGYDAFQWEERALYRAVRWLHEQAGYPAEGDDGWQPHLVNHVYGTSFPAPLPAGPGKNVGWTDWTHG